VESSSATHPLASQGMSSPIQTGQSSRSSGGLCHRSRSCESSADVDLIPLGRQNTQQIKNSRPKKALEHREQPGSPSFTKCPERSLCNKRKLSSKDVDHPQVQIGPTSKRSIRTSHPAPVPDEPRARDSSDDLLDDTAQIAADEIYGADEKALNEFIVHHPMLNLEITSQKTLQIIGSLFEQCNTSVPSLPVIDKSYDDSMLRPPNKQIGERECACGDRCMVRFLARLRHGSDTKLAFTCTEFLLPSERSTFLSGGGLPTRKKKCLVCTRYLMSYLYYKARMDPNFTINSTGIDSQSFANSVASPVYDENPPDYKALTEAQNVMPESASSVLTPNSYKPEVMLFVDEDWACRQASRSGHLSAMQWVPIVRFCAQHYNFHMTADGPRVVQVGVASHETGPLFQKAPVAERVAPPEPCQY